MENIDPGTALELVTCGVVLVDGGGVVRHANRTAREALGLGPLEGLSVHGIFAHLRPDRPSDSVAAREGRLEGPLLFRMTGGRMLACTGRRMDPGGWVLTLAPLPFQVRPDGRRDPLTQLPDRAAFQQELEALLGAGDPGLAPGLAVLCVDLDRFKTINDSLGHPLGDELLRKAAERLAGLLRSGDMVARMGGDEFTILHRSSDPAFTAEVLARRVVDVVGRTYAIESHILNIGASVGIALAPRDGAHGDDLLRRADLALYAAKADGRATFRFFEPEMEQHLNARRSLEFDLRKALALRQFSIVYQPQVEIATGRISGFEALLRWKHPVRGLVSPAEFIPLAEEIGAIIPIGDWVLRTACRQATSWPAHVRVAVNLSPIQFRGPRLFESIATALRQSGLEAARLELEITESALIHDTEVVLDLLNRVRALGVRVSMDDFGTGYSSLSYLQRFPFDKVKIDQSFVRGPGAEGDKQAIVRAIAGLGASLGIRTTAEGVETPEQLERMRQEGCTEVQGYLLGRPLSPEDTGRFIASKHGTPANLETSP